MTPTVTPQTLAWLEDQKSDLVVAAMRFVDQSKIYQPPAGRSGPRAREPRVTPSQLRNLLSTARDEPFEVLRGYLRYQIGRGSRGWADRSSGDALLALLEEQVRDRARVAEDLAQASDREKDAACRRLASLLVGFIVREQTYRAAVHQQTDHSRAQSSAASKKRSRRSGS